MTTVKVRLKASNKVVEVSEEEAHKLVAEKKATVTPQNFGGYATRQMRPQTTKTK